MSPPGASPAPVSVWRAPGVLSWSPRMSGNPPPYPCCGGLTFHAEWCTGETRSYNPLKRPAFVPSAFRFTWRTAEVMPSSATVEEGRAFRAVRVRYCLTLREVAAGWRVSDVEVGGLERGKRRFQTPADFGAALSQLWLWAVEKNPRIAAG